MLLKKFTAAFLCIALLNISLAEAAPISTFTTTPAPSAEFTLLSNVVALQGQVLSQQEEETQLSALLSQYATTAPKTGEATRLQQAMIDLGMYTPAQAAAFVANAQGIASSGMQSGLDMNTMLSQVMSGSAAGAQFSWCAMGGGLLAGASGFVLLLGYALAGIAPGSDTPANNRAFIIGGAGMAAAVTLIVVGAAGEC